MPPVFFVPCCVCCATEYKRLMKFIGKKTNKIFANRHFCVLSSHQISKKNTQIKTENYV